MSEDKKELEILQQMKKKHEMYLLQRDQAQINFQQLIGAIYAFETMIKDYENYFNNKLVDTENTSN